MSEVARAVKIQRHATEIGKARRSGLPQSLLAITAGRKSLEVLELQHRLESMTSTSGAVRARRGLALGTLSCSVHVSGGG
jgi:hypothetical protein